MELNLDEKYCKTNIPKVPSITRISENHQYKKSEIIEIKKPKKTQYLGLNNLSHIISPQDSNSLFKFRQIYNT